MSDLSDRLFVDLYDGPDFEKIPSLRNFRRRLMSAVQSAVSYGLPISVNNEDSNVKSEYLTVGGLNYNDIFMFNNDGNWLKAFHRVGDSLYKILPLNVKNDGFINKENLIEIPAKLGFHLNWANKLYIPNYKDLSIYGMNLR